MFKGSAPGNLKEQVSDIGKLLQFDHAKFHSNFTPPTMLLNAQTSAVFQSVSSATGTAHLENNSGITIE